jgi:hypothetical protein
MQTAEEFLKRAAECELMATEARDRGSKATWKGMAARWRQCAEMAAADNLAARRRNMPARNRQSAPTLAVDHP